MIKKLLVGLMSLMLTFMFMMPVSAQDNGLELGPELVDQPARQLTLPAPTIDKVFYDATTISGDNVQRKRVGGKAVRSTVYVTLKDKNGNEKVTVSVTSRSGTSWTVNLPGGVTVAAGDTVTAYQTLDGATSSVVTANAEPSMANQITLTMPVGEIWIEQTNSNIVSDDEQAEAIEMLKKANPDIAKDFKSVKFSIDGTDHAYYEVTYTDGSKSGKVEAPDLKIKTVTEKSAAPTIEKVQVTDEQIIVTLDREVAQGTKFYFVKNFTDGEDKNFCEDGNCKADKSTSQEMSQEVSVDGTKVTFQINNDDLILRKEFGIIVKEPHKFRSCAESEPVVTTPDKVAVRDPHKLTDTDKQAIDKAIRDANTINGKSKLPDGTGDNDGTPAFIEFDKDGNVTIISPNDVEVTWDSSYNPIYVKNPDGTYKLQSGRENNVFKFPAKDLVKNIAPKSPAIAVDTDKGEVTITPPAYKEPGDDTDLISYTVSYNDDKGNKHTVTATRDLKTNKWSGTGVNEETGVITLSVEDVELAGTITATAKDNGGLEGDTDKLDSDPASKKLETANVSYVSNGGTGNMDSKKLNKGSKYKILANGFTAPKNQKFKAWEIDGKEVAPNTDITVNEDTVVKAIWQDIEVKVSYDSNGGSGTMEGKTMKKGSTYKLLANGFTAPKNQKFKAWEIDGKEVAPNTEIKVDKDTVVKAIWQDIEVKVSYDANGGSGTMAGKTMKKGSTYKLLANGFTAPKNQKFKAWEIDGKEIAPGTDITVNEDTVVKAIWQDIEVKVSYDANGGSGTMAGKTLKKGSTYKLLANSFTAPKNQKFKAWEIDGKEVAPGTDITVNEDTVVKALWQDIEVKVSYDANGGSGTMAEKTMKKGSTYKLLANSFTAPENQKFKAWEIDGKEVAPGTDITVNEDTVVEAIWQDIEVKVSYDSNGGSGTMEGKTMKKGDTYKLLTNGFTAPENQKFKAWEIDGKEVAPNTEIKVDKDTVIKAIWQDKPSNDTENPGNNKDNANGANGSSSSGPKTGDSDMIYLYASVLIMATGIIFVIGRKRRKEN